MGQQFFIQDLAISIDAKGLNPALVNPDILRYSGVVPADWELARMPVQTKNAAQFVFTNGINIIAEVNRVMFAETLHNKSADSTLVAEIAQKYAESLPNLEFKGLSTNFTGYVPLDVAQPAGRYIPENLLAPGPWQEEGMRASLTLLYNYDRASFYLSITEAKLQKDEDAPIPIVMFSGRFNYSLAGDTAEDRLNKLHQALSHVQDDRITYADLITNKFLGQSVTPVLGTSNLLALSAAV